MAEKPLPALGMVIALHSESVCLSGRRHWQKSDGHLVKRKTLPDRTRLLVTCSGMGNENARNGARRLIDQGAGALVSIGVSAATAPDARSGNLVVAERGILIGSGMKTQVLQADGAIARYACRTLSAAGLSVRCGILATAAQPVFSPEEKLEYFTRFGAAALDMESAAVAKAAAEAGIPFFILRAVSDPVMQSVPPRLFACLDAFGRLRFSVFCREIFSRPVLLCELGPLAIQFRTACHSLKAGWSVLEKSGLPAMLLGKA